MICRRDARDDVQPCAHVSRTFLGAVPSIQLAICSRQDWLSAQGRPSTVQAAPHLLALQALSANAHSDESCSLPHGHDLPERASQLGSAPAASQYLPSSRPSAFAWQHVDRAGDVQPPRLALRCCSPLAADPAANCMNVHSSISARGSRAVISFQFCGSMTSVTWLVNLCLVQGICRV